MKDAAEVLEHNLGEFFEHGPGLRYSTQTVIVAKGNGKKLVFGLGGLGVGQMVFTIEPKDQEREDYKAAPEVDDPDNWFFDVMTMKLQRQTRVDSNGRLWINVENEQAAMKAKEMK